MVEINSLKAKIYSRLGQRGTIFGLTLLDIAEAYPQTVLLTADLALLSGLDRFITKYPERFYNIGIAEQNMIGIASGLSAENYLPIATTYATFITLRSCEQIRHYLGYMKLKVLVIGSGAGLVQGFSGGTHYSIEDIAVMRAIPNIKILSPSDGGQAAKAFEAAIKSDSSTYIRLTGGLNCPIIYKDDFTFEIGKSIIVKEGTDIVIFATGFILYNTIKAAQIIDTLGISTKVIDIHTIKPIDKNAIESSHSKKLIVTIEEHNVIGGLGGAVAEELTILGNCPPLLRLGINDRFSLSGDHNFLIEKYRLTPELIAEDIVTRYKTI